jgi:hypothetical protein
MHFFRRLITSAQLADHHALAIRQGRPDSISQLKIFTHRLLPWRFGPWRRPKSDQQLGQIAHAGSPKSLESNGFLENGSHRAALFVVAPEFGFEALSGGVIILGGATRRLNFSLPEVSFLHMSLQVIKHPLLAPVETHGANVEAYGRKTTGKASDTVALQS